MLVKAATPLAAEVPISIVVVPSSDPLPDVKARVSGRVEGMPTVERLPNWSCDLRTGWLAKGDPIRETPPGWVVNTSCVAALGLTRMFCEITLVKPAEVKLIVIVSATL